MDSLSSSALQAAALRAVLAGYAAFTDKSVDVALLSCKEGRVPVRTRGSHRDPGRCSGLKRAYEMHYKGRRRSSRSPVLLFRPAP